MPWGQAAGDYQKFFCVIFLERSGKTDQITNFFQIQPQEVHPQ